MQGLKVGTGVGITLGTDSREWLVHVRLMVKVRVKGGWRGRGLRGRRGEGEG